MRTAFRRAVTVPLVLALSLGPLPAPGRADDSVAKIKRIVFDDLKEVPYPTKLVQLVTEEGDESDVSKNMSVGAGEAVLTRSANTFVQVEKGREAFLYSNTFVRFDDLNVWLLRNGAMYVVNKIGRLEIVAEALGRILVSSKVLLRSDGSELFAFVTEGRVVLEAGARTLSLGPGQAGRMTMGSAPEPASLGPEEQAQISKELEATEGAMKGGGGGLWKVLVGAAVVGGAIAVLSGGGSSSGGAGDSGGSQALPDLVAAVDVAGRPCRFDDSGNLVVSVRNQGRAGAGPSTAAVELEAVAYARTADGPAVSRQSMELRTGALAAGAATDLHVPTRRAQIRGYRVTVDRDGQVRESNEGNNTAAVSCQAPVG